MSDSQFEKLKTIEKAQAIDSSPLQSYVALVDAPGFKRGEIYHFQPCYVDERRFLPITVENLEYIVDMFNATGDHRI